MFAANENQMMENQGGDASFGIWEISSDSADIFKDLLVKATCSYQSRSSFTDYLKYGVTTDNSFLQATAKFLSYHYKDEVKCDQLLATYGATFGSLLAITHFLQAKDFLFVEEVSFRPVVGEAREHNLEVVTVASDKNGILCDQLEHALAEAKSRSQHLYSERQPFWGILYLIPCFHNPTGVSMTPERCRKVVQLARKYSLLVITDDVYNVFCYGQNRTAPPFEDCPKRLVAYDCQDDDDFGNGHVISNGSFSKILAPSFRIGWYESSSWIIRQLEQRADVLCGGGYNFYIQGLAAEILSHADFEAFFDKQKVSFAERYWAAVHFLKENLHKDVTFTPAFGGFFLWLALPKHLKAEDLKKHFSEMYGQSFLTSSSFAIVPGKFDNCLRLCVTVQPVCVLIRKLQDFCKAVQELIAQSGS